MNKTILTDEESARLIELGVEHPDAWINEITHDINGDKFTPRVNDRIFSLSQLIRILPKKITDRRNIYELRMGVTDCLCGDEHWYVVYKDSRTDIDELESFQSAEELIDAIYQEICWLKTEKIKEL